MQRVKWLAAFGAVLSCTANPALAQTGGASVQPDPFRCLTKATLTDSLCNIPQGDGEEGAFSFTSINQYGELTGDFDNDDDIRGFTSEAMFAETRGAVLTDSVLRAIARVKPQWESYNRASFRIGDSGAIDLSYKRRELDEAQITIFSNPTVFNDIGVDEYGIGYRLGDLRDDDYYVRAAYRHATRTGLIEFDPGAADEVDELQLEGALNVGATRYSATLVHQEIDLQIPAPYDRGRDIVAAGVEHSAEQLRYFAGVAYDREIFGATEARKVDLYGGIAYRPGQFEYGAVARLFTSEVSTDPTRDNSQLRLEGLLAWRAGTTGDRWPFAVQFPVAYDTALDGLDAFENYRIGAEIIWRYPSQETVSRHAVLVSARFDHQEFFNIGDSADTFLARLAFGFS